MSERTTTTLGRATALIGTLAEHRLIGYGEGLPSALDEQFAELAALYREGDGALREQIRAAVPDDTRLLLLGFSGRLATVAARRSDADRLRAALLSHAIEDFRHDPRENVLRLVVVHHVAEQLLKLDPAALFGEVAALSSAHAAEQLQAFLDRPKALKRLKAMRVHQIDTPEGVQFEYR